MLGALCALDIIEPFSHSLFHESFCWVLTGSLNSLLICCITGSCSES